MSYYDDLGVDKSATPEEIKKAYKRKAQKLAPRTSEECNDAERSRALVRINKAHETLSDAKKREYYDLHGEDAKLSSLDQQAMAIIYGILANLSEQFDEGDFVESIVLNLRNNLDNLSRQEPQLRKRIAKAERQRKLIRRKQKGEENLLDRVFQQQIDQLNHKISELPEALALGKRALEIMKDYENAYGGAGQQQRRPVGLEALLLGMDKMRGF